MEPLDNVKLYNFIILGARSSKLIERRGGTIDELDSVIDSQQLTSSAIEHNVVKQVSIDASAMETDFPLFEIDPANPIDDKHEPGSRMKKSIDPVPLRSGIDHHVPIKSELVTGHTGLESAKPAIPRKPLSLSNMKATSRLTNEESTGGIFPHSASSSSREPFQANSSMLAQAPAKPCPPSTAAKSSSVIDLDAVDMQSCLRKQSPSAVDPGASSHLHPGTKVTKVTSVPPTVDLVCVSPPPQKTPSMMPKRSVSDSAGKVASSFRKRSVSEARSGIRVRPYPGKEPPSIIEPSRPIGKVSSVSTVSHADMAVMTQKTVLASNIVGNMAPASSSLSQKTPQVSYPVGEVVPAPSTPSQKTPHVYPVVKVTPASSTLPQKTPQVSNPVVEMIPASSSLSQKTPQVSNAVGKVTPALSQKTPQASNLVGKMAPVTQSRVSNPVGGKVTPASQISHASTAKISQETAHSSRSDLHSSRLHSKSSQPTASSLHSVHQASLSSHESVSDAGTQESLYSQPDSFESAATFTQPLSQQEDSTGKWMCMYTCTCTIIARGIIISTIDATEVPYTPNFRGQ